MDEGLSPHVENLGHALEAVRIRALRTILAKLDLELITLDELLDQPNLVLHLINWLKTSNHVCTEEILALIHNLVKQKQGLDLLIRYDPGLSVLSKAVGPIGVEFIQNLRKSFDKDHLEPVRDTDSSILSSMSSVKTSSSSLSPKNGKIRKKKKKKCAFHEGLASSDLSASSLPWDAHKSSKSSELSSELSLEEIRSQLNTLSSKRQTKSLEHRIIQEDVISSSSNTCSSEEGKWPQIRWPSPDLAEADLKILKTVGQSLRDREQCEEAVNFLSTVLLQDFPPQIFLNDISILQSLLRLAEDKTHHQEVVVKCLGELTYSLMRYHHFYNDFMSHPRSSSTVASLGFVPTERSEKAKDGKISKTLKNLVPMGISLGDYCGFVLEKVGPDVPGILRLLSYCVPDAELFWQIEDNNCLVLKLGVKSAFSRFGATLLREKAVDSLKRVRAHIGMYQLMRAVIPSSSASIVIPHDLQRAIYLSLLDPVLNILYPRVSKLFRSYVQSLEIRNGIPYDEYFLIADSLEAGAEFIKTTEWPSIDECVKCFSVGIPGLEFHQQYGVISNFVDFITKQNGIPYDEYFLIADSLEAGAEFIKTTEWPSIDECVKCFSVGIPGLEFHQQYGVISNFVDFITKQNNVSTSQIQTVQNISLTLFSSVDLGIKQAMYESASRAVNSFLGPHVSSKNNVPFPQLYFVLNKKTLWEIISYGLSNSSSQIRECSSNILILTLKCQAIVTVTAWREILSVLLSVSPLLHSVADMNSNVGRAIVSSLDPDVAHLMNLPDLEVLKGNVRLMMSRDDRTRDEGKSRVMYLVDLNSQSGKHQSFNLSLDPTTGQSKAPASYEEGSLLRVLEVMKAGSDDVNMLKSAITQLSLMTEDSSLHIIFLDNGGVELAMGLLKSSVELPNSDSQHFFMHSVVALKHIAECSMQVRWDFASDFYLLTVLLKGIFLYGDDWRILRDASQLLTLVVMAELILSKDGKLSFPHVVVKSMRLPFQVIPYGEKSEKEQPSRRGKILTVPAVQKSLGLRWLSLTVKGGIEGLLGPNAKLPAISPQLLPVSSQDLSSLTVCSVPYNLKVHLDNLSSAYSHATAEDAIEHLTLYLKIAIAVESANDLPELAWENSFKRYLTTLPASGMDQILLSSILRFLNLLLAAVPSQLCWVSKIVKDPAFGFNSLLAQLLVADMDITAKELSLEILSLVEICLDERGGETQWDYVKECLVQCLSQSHTQQFYSIAIMSKLLKCLLKISEKKIIFKTKSLWKLLNAFHCQTPNSCMGLTITRLTLLCLCNILPLHPRTSEIVKSAGEIKWLWVMLNSSDVIVKSASLELLSCLCNDTLTTENILSQSPDLFDFALRILLDSNESNLARERAVNLCNVILTNSSNKTFITSCVDAELFKCVALIASRVDFNSNPTSQWFYPAANPNRRDDPRGSKKSAINLTSPSLLSSCCDFCLNLITKDRDHVLEAIQSQGLSSQLFRHVSQWQSSRALCKPEKVVMYASICRLLIHCTKSAKSPVLECIPVMVWLLQDSSYCDTIDKTELISQSIMLLSSIVGHHKESKVIFTKEAVETICGAFKSSNAELTSAVTSSLPPLSLFLTADASVAIVKGLGEYNPNHRVLLSGILGSSNAATIAALECGLLPPILNSLRKTNINLASVPMDIPRNKKANALLNSLSVDFGLITNFLAGSAEVKDFCAELGLADAMHKLWAWCLLDQDLLCSLLQVLVTFTADCPSGATSLVFTSNIIGIPQRKIPSSNSILHAAIGLLSKDTYSTEVKTRILELTSHACQALESRNVLAKSTIISEFLKFTRLKRSLAVDELEVPWLEFLIIFTYFPEGQALIKNDAFFSQLLLYMSCGRPVVKPLVMSIFRNLTFHPNNRQKLMVCDRWLKVLADRALQLSGAGQELENLALIIWYLIANSQRGKSAVRSESLDTRLQMAAASLPDGHPTLLIVEEVIRILRPESRDS